MNMFDIDLISVTGLTYDQGVVLGGAVLIILLAAYVVLDAMKNKRKASNDTTANGETKNCDTCAELRCGWKRKSPTSSVDIGECLASFADNDSGFIKIKRSKRNGRQTFTYKRKQITNCIHWRQKR